MDKEKYIQDYLGRLFECILAIEILYKEMPGNKIAITEIIKMQKNLMADLLELAK